MLKVYYLKMSEISSEDILKLRKKSSVEALKEADLCKSEKVVLTKLLKDVILTKLLFELKGLKRQDYIISLGKHGKPNLNIPFYFNISHSKDYWACAFSDCKLGFDIEKIADARMEVAKRFFHINEIESLKKISGKEQDEKFFELWAAKESFIKYTASGLSRSLSSFEIVANKIKDGDEYLNLFIRPCVIDTAYKSYITTELVSEPVEVLKLNLSDII